MIGRLLSAALIAAMTLSTASAQDDSATVTVVYDDELPNVAGKSIKGVLVEYPPGGKSPAHTHAPSAFIYATVLEGAIRSLSAWRESELYTEREQAALAWAESLTRIGETHAPDSVYDEARRVFSEDELVALSFGVAMINAWNRLTIGFRLQHPADRRRAA